jgi:hypothetical protein
MTGVLVVFMRDTVGPVRIGAVPDAEVAAEKEVEGKRESGSRE